MAMLLTLETAFFFHESLLLFIGEGVEANIVNIHGVGVSFFALVVLHSLFAECLSPSLPSDVLVVSFFGKS